jgi:hypothetical protein
MGNYVLYKPFILWFTVEIDNRYIDNIDDIIIYFLKK